jgi:hypothetical protein
MNQDSWTHWARNYSGEKLQSRIKDLPDTLKPFLHDGKIKIAEIAVSDGESRSSLEKRVRDYISSVYCTKEIVDRQKHHFLGKDYIEGKGYYDRDNFPTLSTKMMLKLRLLKMVIG